MKYLQLKNFRSIENAEFIFGSQNYFVGDNNTGKTSTLRLIESIFKNRTLNFDKTYLSKFRIIDLAFDVSKNIDLFYGFERKECNKSEKDFKMHFEFIEITNIELYEYPLISRIVTLDDSAEYICEFNIQYFVENEEANIKTIEINRVKNNFFKNIKNFKTGDFYIEKLKKILSDREQVKNIFREELVKDTIIKKFNDFKQKMRSDQVVTPEDHIDYLKYSITTNRHRKLSIDSLYSLYILKTSETDYSSNKINSRFFSFSTRAFEDFFDIDYIAPLRPVFEEFYKKNELDAAAVKPLINGNIVTLEKINDFLKITKMADSVKILPKRLEDGSIFYFPVFSKGKKEDLKLSISGTGISQVMPILNSLFSEKYDKIFMEQPEIHLHPRAQSQLGSVLGEFYKKTNSNYLESQIFIETHSMYLLDKLSINLKQKNSDLTTFNISFFYFDNSFDSSVRVENIFMKNNGKYTGNIDNFLSFFIKEAIEKFS